MKSFYAAQLLNGQGKMPSLASAILGSFQSCSLPKQQPNAGLDDVLAKVFVDSEESRGKKRGRYATSTTVAERQKWQGRLLELRGERQAAGHKGMGAALSEWIWREWPATKTNKKEFLRCRKLCYRLLKQDLPMTVSTGKRQRLPGGGRRPLAMDISFELFQWFIDAAPWLCQFR